MLNPRLFIGSLFQFNTVTATPALEQSIGASTIGSDDSTGNGTPASFTGATIQFRMTGEKFEGNFPSATLDDFTYDSPGNQAKCTTVPLFTERRIIAGELSSDSATTSPLTAFVKMSRGPHAVASREPVRTFPSALTPAKLVISIRSRSGLCAPRRLVRVVEGSSYLSIAPAFEIATSVPPPLTQVANSF